MTQTTQPFWKRKKLNEMTQAEWESLCDGCARCCLHKLEDEEDGQVYYTNVACRLLDLETCRCGDYPNRSTLNPDCIPLTTEVIPKLRWLPDTCAYRLVSEGQDLPWWHHLVSGDPELVHSEGVSLQGKAFSENDVDMDNLEDYILDSEEDDDA